MPFINNETAAIKLTPAQEAEIAKMGSVSEIQTYLHRVAEAQHLIRRDEFDTRGDDYFSYHPVEAGSPAAAKSVAKTVTVNGQKHVIEGATEAELVKNELALMRSLFAQPADGTQQRDSQGRFVAQPSQEEIDGQEAQQIVDAQAAEEARIAAANADPTAAALAPSVTAALQAAGIDVNALRDFTETKQNEKFTQSWADAAEQFRESHPKWIGGEENKNILAEILSENNLTDAEDKIAALQAAYNFAIENKMFVEPAEQRQARKISTATTYEELKAAVGYKDSSLFGR